MALNPELRTVLESSDLTFEEVRAFETGLMLLTDAEQIQFAEHLQDDPELLYPLYINFKAKLHAVQGDSDSWMEAVETEIEELEQYIAKKRVGNEIK